MHQSEEKKPDKSFTPTAVRSRLKLEDLSTPIVENIMSILPSGHDKALKDALYHVFAAVISTFVILAFWGVFCVLEPFFKPLLWAVLCGTVLHPIKHRLCSASSSCLENSEMSSTPFTLQVMLSPLIVADYLSEKVGSKVYRFWKPIICVVLAFFGTYFIYYKSPISFSTFLSFIFDFILNGGLMIFSCVSLPLVVGLIVVYIVFIVLCIVESNRLKSIKNLRSIQFNDTDGTATVTEPDGEGSPYDSFIKSHKNQIRSLSLLTWFFSSVYIFKSLPLLFRVVCSLFLLSGAVTYIRCNEIQPVKKLKKHLPKIAATLVRNITSSGREVRRRTSSGGSKSNSVRSDRFHLQRSMSEGVIDSSKLPISEISSSTADMQQKLSKIAQKTETIKESNSEDEVDNLNDSSFDSETGTENHYTIESNMFLYGVFCACLVIQVWRNLWILHLLPIPFVYYLLKKFASHLGFLRYMERNVVMPITDLMRNEQFSDIFLSYPIGIFFKAFSIMDHHLVSVCKNYVDPVATIFILVMMVLASLVAVIFSASQIYAEGDHLVRVSVDLINSTVSQYPEINEIMPDGWQSVMGSLVDNSYHYGREYIAKMIRTSISDENGANAEEIEKHAIQLWDKVYESWNKRWDDPFETPKNEQNIEWDAIIQAGKNVPLLFDYNMLANFAKANVGTLFTLVESVWQILLGNMSLLFSSVTFIFSVLFGGGSAIVNLIINLVVFFTALFYLLSTSNSVYKPVELFQALVPTDKSKKENSYSNKLLTALEEAVNSIFVASFKMCSFYGMWTWLIHTLFGVNIVFLPSLLAATFGAVPIMMPYWAAVPAVAELWLIQKQWTKAILMFCAQMVPMSMVDAQIYSEVKGGGHPYLTGLAVAGGIFYFGVQGAIMGPIILCCVVVAVKVGSTILKEGNETLKQ